MIEGMPGWISIVIAAIALAYTIWANRQERHTREKEFALLRKQTEIAEHRDLEERRAYVSVDPRGSEGGESVDLHRFRVTNAGPATVRHVALQEWLEHERRKERVVGPLSPVSPLP